MFLISSLHYDVHQYLLNKFLNDILHFLYRLSVQKPVLYFATTFAETVGTRH